MGKKRGGSVRSQSLMPCYKPFDGDESPPCNRQRTKNTRIIHYVKRNPIDFGNPGRHRRLGQFLTQRLPRGAQGHARPLSQAPLAGGPRHGGADRADGPPGELTGAATAAKLAHVRRSSLRAIASLRQPAVTQGTSHDRTAQTNAVGAQDPPVPVAPWSVDRARSTPGH